MKHLIVLFILLNVFSAFSQNNIFPTSGNAGIGTISPVEKLELNNAGEVGIRLFNTTANTWDIKNTTNGRLDFIRGGNNTFMRIDQFGNVGIGTTSPYTRLDVQSTNAANFGTMTPCCANSYTISLSENTQVNSRIPSIQFHASGYQEAFLRLASDARVLEIGDNQSVGVDFAIRNAANSSRNVLISGRGNTYFNGGNVGVGTTNPQYPLHILGGTAMPTGWNKTAILQATYPVLLFNSNNQKWAGIGYDYSDGGMRFWVNKSNDDLNSTAPSLGILNNGNVWLSSNIGIGTSSPNAPLQFASSTTNRKIVMWEGGNNDNQFYGFGVNPGVLRYQVSDGANHVFYASTSSTSSNELFRIQSNGNVGIGNSNPAYRLSVNGTLYSNKATFVGQNPGANYTDGAVEIREVNTVGTGQTSDNYAPRITFHWGFVASKSIALGRNGNFKFNNQNDINSYANIEVGDIISKGNMSLKGTIESRYYSVPINGGINVQRYADTTTAHLNFYDNSNGRVTAVRRLLSGEGNNGLGFYGFYNGAWANILTMKDEGKVGIGTLSIPADYKLAVAGNIIAEKIKVKKSNTWPDFVFLPNYNLPTLKEVENYLKQNNHLPEIPSATEIEKDGQDLGEMNRLLLKKVEELTLYIINQEKDIQRLKGLESEVAKLKLMLEEVTKILKK